MIEICGDYWAFTPGFWKNHYNPSNGHEAWIWTAYANNPTVQSVFDPDNSLTILTTAVPGAKYGALGSFTLLEALGFKGGSGDAGAAQILLRAGTAALLNASFHEYWTDHAMIIRVTIHIHPLRSSRWFMKPWAVLLRTCSTWRLNCMVTTTQHTLSTGTILRENSSQIML